MSYLFPTTDSTIVNAELPFISSQSAGAAINVGGTLLLNVGAFVTDGGTLTYQWHANTAKNNIDGTAILGATNAAYTPDTSKAGTYYYYVVITNTNNNVNGTKITTTKSNVTAVIVSGTVIEAVGEIEGFNVSTGTIILITAIGGVSAILITSGVILNIKKKKPF